MEIAATYLGANGWFIEFNDINILLDPWLKGKLTFPLGSWLLEGSLAEETQINKRIDLILLTQGLDDHTHIPTLKELNKNIPILGSNKAGEKTKKLGFEKVETIFPDQQKKIGNLSIKATAGANVPHIENGYIISHPCGSIYIEPHGFLDSNIKEQQIDTLITPIVNVGITSKIDFIKGNDILPKLIKKFRPKTILGSTTGGEISYKGVLAKFMRMKGNWEREEAIIEDKIKLICPKRLGKYFV